MRIEYVRTAISNQDRVKYSGDMFVITACIMRLSDKRWVYQLELIGKNGIIIADMEAVSL